MLNRFIITLCLATMLLPALAGMTSRVSVSNTGAQGNNATTEPSVSMDGRYVAFTSRANNLVNGDTNGDLDVFVRDRQAGTTVRVSVASDGTQGESPRQLP